MTPMTRLAIRFALATLLVPAAVPAFAQDGDVCFYKDENFDGDHFCANARDAKRNVGSRWNDEITSIRVFGRVEVTVYDDEDYEGDSRVIRDDVKNLRDWNDRITSFKVSGARRAGGGSEPRNGACFYVDPDYEGARFCMSSGESNSNVGSRFNDRISSIRVFGRARVTVYDDEDFEGASQDYRRDASDLRRFDDRITSIEVD